MTQSQIEAKLRLALTEDITREKDVMYILGESRKLIEKIGDANHFALRLYCHWALHADLTRPSTTLDFLRRVDNFIEGELDHRKLNVAENHRVFREFIYLDTFRKELREFFARFALPTGLCDEDQRWYDFLKLYAGIIQDGSLYCGENLEEAKRKGLKLIMGVTFSKGRAAPPDSYFPFYFMWEVRMQDGRTIEVDVNAAPLPGGSPMLVHGLRVKNPPTRELQTEQK
jgi:hypothetical protein